MMIKRGFFKLEIMFKRIMRKLGMVSVNDVEAIIAYHNAQLESMTSELAFLKNTQAFMASRGVVALIVAEEIQKAVNEKFRDAIKEGQEIKGDKKMTKLTAKARKAIPKKEFGMPGERKYPMPDKAHAKNAKARASEMEHKGKISPGTKTKIDAKANKVLGKTKRRVLRAKPIPR